MPRHTSRRVVAAAALLWVVVTLVCAFLRRRPRDPVLVVLGAEGGAQALSPDQVATARRALNLGRPFPEQHRRWFVRLGRLDLGTSPCDTTPVTADVLVRPPRSLQLIAAASALAVTGASRWAS